MESTLLIVKNITHIVEKDEDSCVIHLVNNKSIEVPYSLEDLEEKLSIEKEE